MKLYLDNCSIQRPLDDKSQVRIAVEAEAILGVIQLIEGGQIDLVRSPALIYEINRTSNIERRSYALQLISKSKFEVRLSPAIEHRASQLNDLGIDTLDALHLAFAEASQADFFCTYDDKLIKRALALSNLAVVVVNPLELIQEIEQ